MKKFIYILSLFLFAECFAQVQPTNEYSIVISDSLNGNTTLQFGIDPLATDTYDFMFGETELPPVPPVGGFDARFLLPAGNFNGSESSVKDYRGAILSYTGQKEFRLLYQVGAGATKIIIAWNLPLNVTGNLKDIFTGTLINVNMSGIGSYTVTNHTTFNRLKMFINFSSVNIQPRKPLLSFPNNFGQKIPTNLTMKWNSASFSNLYNIQLSTDSLFANLVLNNSTIADTFFSISNLVELENYYWRVRGLNQNGNGWFSDVWRFKTLIEAPDSLTATANGLKKNLLKWRDNSTKEQKFIIERKLGDTSSINQFVIITTVLSNITSYIDTTNLSDSVRYTYRIRAINNLDSSKYSNLATVVTFIPVELSTFWIEEIKNGFKLNWTTISEKNNRGFEIERITDSEIRSIGFVEGRGTSTSLSKYNYTDFIQLKNTKTISYRLKQIDYDGTFHYFISNSLKAIIQIKDFGLEQNYPNPFNGTTTVKFSVPRKSKVTLNIYNILGIKLTEIVNKEFEPGTYEVRISTDNYSSGSYFYEMISGDYKTIKKMILLK